MQHLLKQVTSVDIPTYALEKQRYGYTALRMHDQFVSGRIIRIDPRTTHAALAVERFAEQRIGRLGAKENGNLLSIAKRLRGRQSPKRM